MVCRSLASEVASTRNSSKVSPTCTVIKSLQEVVLRQQSMKRRRPPIASRHAELQIKQRRGKSSWLAFACVTMAVFLAELRVAALQGTTPLKALARADAVAWPKKAGRKGCACKS